MHKKYIIYFPFNSANSYIENMKRCWESMYRVIPISSAESNIFVLFNTKAIVLNWVEGELDNRKKIKLILYKLLGIKIIWVFHNRLPHAAIENLSMAETANKNMHFLATISDAILLHSKNSRIYLEEYTCKQNKIFYVPHVNYMKQYRWVCDYNSINDCNDFIFVFQGAILPYKNIELLIYVFKELQLPHCQLYISGISSNKEYTLKIQQLSQSAKIKIQLGYLSDYAVGEIVRQADVVILPYDIRSSMNSGAMLTAFTNKRTVIVSNNAMAQDYKNKDFLYIYDYSSPTDHYEQLKQMMKQAYNNGKSVNRKMGERAYEYIKKHNSDAIVIQKLKNVMEYI